MKSSTILSLLMASAVQGHMLLRYPQAFAISDKPDNGPLTTPADAAKGIKGNYPCKNTGAADDYDFDFARTQMPLGSEQALAFTGTAVHGGGSCQISLTKDLKPTVNSVFKVIHSIEGGCPARNQAGNMEPANAAAPDPDTYNFTIPSDLEAGDYTLSWTWFNQIGNREFYQNCAPITITGGSSKRDIETRDSSAFDSLPNMLVGNIPEVPAQCSTEDIPENMVVQFPNPGSSLDNTNNPSTQRKLIPGDLSACYAPVGGNAGAGPSSSPSSSSPASSPSSPSSPSPSAPVAASPVVVPTPVFKQPAAATPIASVVPTTAPSAAPQASAAPAASPASGSCATGAVPCSTAGFQCISKSQFGMCANGCMIPQMVAAGTSCVNNAIEASLRRAVKRVDFRTLKSRNVFA